MTDILAVIPALRGGGGGTVTSATAPLSISSGVLSLNLNGLCTAATSPLVLTNGLMSLNASYIPTSHAAFNVGAADVASGAHDLNTQTVTLQNSSGVTAVLSVDLGGNLNVGADGVVTMPILNAWSPTVLMLSDSNGVSRNLASSLTAGLIWNGSTLVDLPYLTNSFSTTTQMNTAIATELAAYTDTNALKTLLAAKQNTLTAGANITI